MGFDEKTHEVNGYSINVKLPNGAYETLMGRLRAERTEVIESNNTRIRKVIFSGPATIVFWEDGTKTVVKCTKGDQLNYEMGIAMCTLKKIFGDSYGYYKKDVMKWIPKPRKDGWKLDVQIAPSYSQKIKDHTVDFSEAFANFLREWGDSYDRSRTTETAD